MRNEKDFDRDFDSVATDSGNSDFINAGQLQKPKNFKRAIKSIIKYVSTFKLRLFFALICVVGSTIFTVKAPELMGQATQIITDGFQAFASGVGGVDFDALISILQFLVVLYVVSAVFGYIQGRLIVGMSVRIAQRLRNELQAKISKLPLSYFDRNTYGQVLSRITNDVEVMGQNLYQCLNELISSSIMLIGILVMMFSISWVLTLVSLVILPLSFLLATFVAKRSIKYFKAQQEYIGHVNGHIEEMYSNHTIVKVFNAEETATEKFDEYNQVLHKSIWKAQFLSGIIEPGMNFMNNLGYVVVCVLGGFFVTIGSMGVGNIQAFLQYTKKFGQPIQQIANISSVLQGLAAASERVFDFLAEEEEPVQASTGVDVSAIKGDIQFKNINFGYSKDIQIIKNFSADIKSGQKIAIVGPTGAGKTTIIKLLMNFYGIDSGDLLIDGHNIKDLTREELRSIFGMVLQDTWTFNGTIMENIRYGKLGASDEDVIEASKSAQVHHYVRTLSEGYKTVLDEESTNISAGQKQLITIARAFLSDPKVLILDEATSSVDTRTEILIQKAMKKLMHGRTSFIIAHRLSTIKDADLILVMDKGNIVEQGTHEELLLKKGFYHKLYNSQFELQQAQ